MSELDTKTLPEFKLYSGLASFEPDAGTENMTVMQKIFYRPYKTKVTFSHNRVFIGWRSQNFYKEDYDKKYNEVYLDLRESSIILILGKRGSGKTTVFRMITDRYVAGKGHAADCSDIKNECQSSVEPNSDDEKQFEKYTRSGEQPTGMKMKAYQPMYLIEENSDPDTNCERIQFRFSDFDLNDWLTLFKLSDNNAEDRRKVEVVTAIFTGVKDGSVTCIDDFKNAIYQQEMAKSMMDSMIIVLDNAVSYGVIGVEHNREFEKDISNGYVVTLNLNGYETKLKSYSQIYVSVFTKKLINAMRNGEIKGKMMLKFDEAPKFYPKNQNISSRLTIDWGIDVTRTWGVSFMLAAQDLRDLPDKAFNQAKYVFLPYNIQFDLFKEILKKLGMIGRYDDATLERYRRMKSEAKLYKDGTRDWMLVDMDKERITRFIPARPLSNHMTE